jgi:uncharacterized protein
MLHYVMDPAALAPLVPRGTQLDRWKDDTYVSLVGFRFLRTRVLGLPIPFHQEFIEVNLRFYVSRVHGDEWRRGVVFVSEVVAQPVIAATARLTYNEPYAVLPTRHFVDMAGAEAGKDGLARYQWKQDRWYTLQAATSGAPEPLSPGSLEEFLTHRYWGYTSQRDGGTIEYQVRHPSWRAWSRTVPLLDCDVARMYGDRFVPTLDATPRSAMVAEGSPVQIWPGVRIA